MASKCVKLYVSIFSIVEIVSKYPEVKSYVFGKGGMLKRNTHLFYGEHELGIVSKVTYLGIYFSFGGAFTEARQALLGQALKAIFMLNKYIR